MKVVVAFGEFTKDVAKIIGGKHEILKDESNLDALIVVANKLGQPEVLVTNGTVLTAISEGGINRGKAMLERLGKIRNIWPRTKIVLILPDDTPESFLQAVISLGIYNVYLVDAIKENQLLNCVEQDKSYSEVLDPLMPNVTDMKYVGLEKDIDTKKNNRALKTTQSIKEPRGLLLLATGDGNLNEAIATSITGYKANMVSNRKELIEQSTELDPAAIVLSTGLSGDQDILDVIYKIKQTTDNILFIAGTMTKTDITLTRIKELGIEVLSDDVNIGTILNIINRMLGNEQQCTYHSEDDIDDEIREGTLIKIARFGNELTKNIPNIPVPKFQVKKKKQVINDKAIAIVSPSPAGKTFIAVNLSVTLSKMGYRVVLVDTDILQSTHTWLNVPQGEDYLREALENDENPLMYAYQLPMLPNLYVLNRDPLIDTPFLGTKALLKLLSNLNQLDEVDIIIIDTHQDIGGPLTKASIDAASKAIIVADQDFSHLVKIQSVLDKMENLLDFNKFSLLVNRVIESQNLAITDAERAVGLKVDGAIPEMTQQVLESIKTDIPAVLFCEDIKIALEVFWHRQDQVQALA